jgi:hypothetical protein
VTVLDAQAAAIGLGGLVTDPVVPAIGLGDLVIDPVAPAIGLGDPAIVLAMGTSISIATGST